MCRNIFSHDLSSSNFGRKVWDTTSQTEESLRMLRELYVAVTRAKRRVVILTSKDVAMRRFLSDLGCDFEEITDPKQFQLEFACDTRAELWYQKGVELFEEGRYDLAASCFASASRWDLSNWSRGKHLKTQGNTSEAAAAYRRAVRCFVEECNYKQALDVLQELSYCPPWEDSDNEMFDRARSGAPAHLSRHEVIRLCLVANRWDEIELRDLKNIDTFSLFIGYKDHPTLNSMIVNCTNEDRSEIGKVLPSLLARYHDRAQNYMTAVELYIRSKELSSAEVSTKKAVKSSKSCDMQVRGCLQAWQGASKAMQDFSKESYINLLIRLYESPMDVADIG